MSESRTVSARRVAWIAVAGCGLALSACVRAGEFQRGSSPVPAEIASEADCPLDRYLACDDSVEAARIRASPVRVERSGVRLTIATVPRPVVLVDDTTEGDSFIRYRYRGYFVPLHAHLVQAAFYEGGHYLLFPDAGGEGTSISAYPVLSPGGRRFAAGVSDIEADYDPSGIQLWEVRANAFHQLFYLGGGSEWGAADLRWLSDDVMEYTRESVDAAGKPVKQRMRLVLRPPGFRVEPVGAIR